MEVYLTRRVPKATEYSIVEFYAEFENPLLIKIGFWINSQFHFEEQEEGGWKACLYLEAEILVLTEYFIMDDGSHLYF